MQSWLANQTRESKAQAWLCLRFRVVFIVSMLAVGAGVAAQSLDERLDEDAFLRGVIELRLADVLETYAARHRTGDPFQSARFDIVAEQIKLADPAIDVRSRLAGLERIREIRTRLAAAHSNDPRAAVLLADQAADDLFELLPTDASGITTLFGAPTVEQRRTAQRAARDMAALTPQAQQLIGQAIRTLESRPGFSTDFALQDQRRRLVEEQRDRRIPFLLGIAAVLQAEVNTSDAEQRGKLYDQAAQLLLPLMDQLPAAVVPTARLYLGLAQARRGEFNAAQALLEQVQDDPHSTEVDVLSARLASVVNHAIAHGPAEALNALDLVERNDIEANAANAFHRLLMADQRYRLCKSLADAAPADQRPLLMARAYAAYIVLLHVDAGVPREAMVAAVFDRLTTVTNAASPADVSAQPAIIAMAQADRLAREASPQSLATSITVLRDVLNRSEVADFEQALALFALGKALFASDQKLEAAERFMDLAERFPADPQASSGRAIDLGVAIAAELHEARPSDGEVRAVLERGLRIAMEQYSNLPTIDQWRLTAAQLALEQNQFDFAEQHLAQIQSSSDRWLDARYLAAMTSLRRAEAEPAEPRDRRQAAYERAVSVIDEAITAIENLRSDSSKAGESPRQHGRLLMLTVLRAEAIMGLDRPKDALAELARIEASASAPPSAVSEALRVRIEAHQALDQPEEAVDEVKRYLAAAPDRASATILPMMQAIERQAQQLIDESRDDEATSLATRTLLPVATLLEDSLASGALPRANAGSAGPRIAEAYRLSGNYAHALTWYERLLASEPDSQPLLLGRAECLFAIGGEERLAQAMTIYKRLGAGGPAIGSDYWLAQLRMLQILDATGRNTQQIVPRIDRLRQGDATLGGERFRRGFDALRSKYSR
jgi:tetratricopeptide (TPR) repeat protein